MHESQSKAPTNGKPANAGESSSAACGDLATSVHAQMMPAYAMGQDVPGVSLFSSSIQTKLAVGAPDDPYEKEADAIARDVMNSPANVTNAEQVRRQVMPVRSTRAISRVVQRALEEEQNIGSRDSDHEEMPVQRKCAECEREVVQRRCAECEREELQRKSREATEDESGTWAPAEAETSIEAMRGGGSSMRESVRTYYESRFGYDFSSVRIHTDARAAQTAQALGARAYTLGADVVLGAGEYAPDTESGGQLLAHELTHVVQQGASTPLSPTTSGSTGDSVASQSAPTAAPAPKLIQRDPPENATITSSTPTAQVAPTSPNTAAMTASLRGLHFQPPAGTTFAAGSRVRQGLMLVVRRLIGAQYRTGLENETEAFLESNTGIQGLGDLAGEASGGEDFTPFSVTLNLAIALIGWLEERNYSINISQEQRDLLRYGMFTSMAWRDIRSTDIIDELGINLPAWYNEDLFRAEMASNIALLRVYIDAATRYRATGSNRAEGIDALRQIVEQITIGARLLEAIRADAALAGHVMYQALWPPPETTEANAPTAQSGRAAGTTARPVAQRPTPAPPDRAPNTNIASVLISFSATQPGIAERAVRQPADRQALLDRFMRFMARVGSETQGDQRVVERHGRANAPPIPALMTSHPALEPPLFDAALDTDHVFSMQLQFADVFEAFLNYAYLWEYARVPDEQLGQVVDVETLPGVTPDWGDVASARFNRAGRYAAADVRRVMDDLGPAGVNALTLVEANSILRYVGTAIRLGLEILTTPRTEKHVVFPGPGLYVVRCKAVPYRDGEGELVRVPSVAYLPVLARPPQEMAESRTAADVSMRERQMQRVVDLQLMLSEPVSHANQEELEEELRTLSLSLGPLENILAEQVRLLEQRSRAPEASAAERAAAERQLGNLRQIIEVRNARAADRSMVGADLIPANFVSDEGQVMRLTLETVPGANAGSLVQYWVSDLTTPNSSQATGIGADPTAAVLRAVRTILEGIHGYGRGYATLHFGGRSHTLRIEASLGSILVEAVENISTAISIAAVIAAPFTAGGSLALLIPVGVVGAIPSAYRLISRAADDTLRLDMATVMDVVNIAGTVIGLGGEAAAGLRMLRLGRGLMIAGMGADGLGMLLMGAQIMEQIEALQDVEPPGVRAARLMEVIGQAMIQVGIMAGSALYQRGRAEELGEAMAPPRRDADVGGTPRRTHGIETPEFTRWFEGLSRETRATLEGRPDLRRLFAEMDPMTRRVLTRCGSSCIPPNASATDVARIEGLLRRLGLGAGDETAVEILREYFHDNRDRLDAAITHVENAASIDDLRTRLVAPFAPSALPHPEASPRGRRTRINPGEDAAVQRSLMRENESADVLAHAGYDVEQNPGIVNGRRPDYRIEGRIFDNYAPSTSNPRNIWSEIQNAKVNSGQADRIVLNLEDSSVSIDALRRQFHDWPMPGLREVIVIRDGSVSHLWP